MNQDERASQLSAMFDGELPAAECELLSRRLARDEQLRATWSRYSVIGAALRAEPLAQVRPDFAHRVSAALSGTGRQLHAQGARRARARRSLAARCGAGLGGGRGRRRRRHHDAAQWPAGAGNRIRRAAATRTARARCRWPQRTCACVAPAAAVPGNELASYTVPPLSNDNNMALQGSLADYVVAHSEYSSPLCARQPAVRPGGQRTGATSQRGAAALAAVRAAATPAQAPAPPIRTGRWQQIATDSAQLSPRWPWPPASQPSPMTHAACSSAWSVRLQAAITRARSCMSTTARPKHCASSTAPRAADSPSGSSRSTVRAARSSGVMASCALTFRTSTPCWSRSDPNAGLLLTGLQGLDSAGQMYRLSEESRTRISGREARVLVVEPQDDLRYGYRVWIDESSAMPLKTQLQTAAGRVVEQLVFTELSLARARRGQRLAAGVLDARFQAAAQWRRRCFGAAPGSRYDLGCGRPAAGIPPRRRIRPA